MRKQVLSILLLLCCASTYAQLSGVKTIDNSIPTAGSNYASFADAVNDLNIQGVGPGGVTFNVMAGQFFPEGPLTLWATGTAADPILFAKSGVGGNPKIMALQPGTNVITGFGTRGDHMFQIAGGDYITIDGIDLQTNAAFGTDSARIEYGYYVTKMDAANASKYVTITHCSVDLNSNPVVAITHSTGFFISNNDTAGTDLTITSDAGRHEYIQITKNSVSNSYHGIVNKGFSDGADPYNYFDHFITVDSNNISLYGGAVDCYGVYFNNTDSNLANINTINTYTMSAGTLYGVYNGFSSGASSTITYNIINLTSPTSTAMVTSIYNASGTSGTGNTIDIGFNEIHSTVNSQFSAIQNDGGPEMINIHGNMINNVINLGPSGSAIYTIWNGPNGNSTISNIYDNTLSGVYAVNGSNVSTVFGLICQNGGAQNNVFRNRIFDLMQNGGGEVVGIRNNAPNSFYTNNYIYDLRAGNVPSNDAVKGLDLNANGPVVVNHNTVLINTSSMGMMTYGTTALYINTDVTAELNNNIFVNLSDPGIMDGLTSAYKRSSTTLNTHVNVSNNNCFYTSAGSRHVVFYDNTNADTTLQAFKLRLGPGREALSFSELPPFISSSMPFDLNLSTSLPTQCESGGKPTTVTTDFYFNTRNASTPDVGAQEGTFVVTDLTGPIISFVPVLNTTSTGNITLTGVEINDASGINVISGTSPRLYFKKAGDPNDLTGWKYTEATNSTSPFSFMTDYSFLSSGVGVGDTIQYFIAAQDASANNNISTYIALSSKTAPEIMDSIGYPLYGPISYYRVLPGLSGVQTVGGMSGTYANLNSVVTALEGAVLTGSVVFELQSGYISNETFPVVFSNNISKDDPGYTVTIRPATGATGLITQGDPGTFTLPLIDLNGATDIIFDGRPTGSTTGIQWTFRNTRTVTPSSIGSVFRLINGAQRDTLRYLQIEGESTSGDGLVYFSTSNATEGNSYNTISNCKIRNRTDVTAIYSASVSSSGTSGAPNAFNTISNNELFNFVNYGVSIGSGSTEGWTISGNHFYNNHSTPPASAQRAILFTPGTGSYNNTISGNYIGGSTTFCGGTPWTNTGNTANFRGIDIDCDTVIVDNNTLRNYAWTGTSGNGWNGIQAEIGVKYADITNNIIGDSLLADTIRVMGTNASAGISSSASGIVNIINNGIHMIYANRAATGTSVKGILNSGNGANVLISGNSISNLYTASTKVNFTTTADFAINGILSSSSGVVMISNNTIKRLSVLTPGTTVVATSGISCSRSAGSTISGNRIFELNMNAVGDSNRIFGIALFEMPSPVTVANNMITVGNNLSSNVYGIGHEGTGSAIDQAGPLEVLHNSVLVNGSVSSGTASNSYAFFSRFSTPTVLKNNILSNERSGGSGNHIAVAQVSSTPSTGWNSDYNIVWTSNTSTTSAWGNPASLGNLAAWQTSSSGDAHSAMLQTTFANAAGGDLHLAAAWFGNVTFAGTALPAVTVDFDGETRTAHPYMGADEVTTHPLPVKLVSFAAYEAGKMVKLKWNTVSEINSDRFEIERSVNGKTFERIGSVKASGNSNIQLAYSFDDVSAPLNTTTVIYYRLKMIDRDSRFEYSSIATLVPGAKQKGTAVSVYPNPFSAEMYVNINAEIAAPSVIEITDLAGKCVFSGSFKLSTGSNIIDLNAAGSMMPGVYFLSVDNGSGRQIIKIIKR